MPGQVGQWPINEGACRLMQHVLELLAAALGGSRHDR